jgi:hypothetical protein
MSERSTGHKKGENKGIARAHKQRKHEEAEKRQAAYNDLTIDEIIGRMDARRGDSKKERAKLAGRGGDR